MIRTVRNALFLVVIALAGVALWRAKQPPPPVYSELDIFLDGGFVQPRDPKIDNWEPTWPEDFDSQPLDSWVIESLKRGWDISNRDELRRALAEPIDVTNRSQAWLLGHLYDRVSEEAIWKGVLADHPNDLEAASWLVFHEPTLNGPQAVLDVLDNLDVSKFKLIDDRGGAEYRASQIEGVRCAALIEVGRAADAETACRHAFAMDGYSGMRTLAYALWERGDLPGAVAQARKVLADPKHHSDGAYFTLAGVLLASGKRDEALRIWAEGRKNFPYAWNLRPELPEKAPTPIEWMKQDTVWGREYAARELAWCGHIYLDFGMRERSEACFAASEKLDPVPAQAQRLVHAGELESPDAEKNALAAADANPHAMLLAAAAWVLEHDHRPVKALEYAKRVYALEPRNVQGVSVIWQACGDLKDWPCLLKYRDIEGLDSHLPPPDWQPIVRP